MENKKVNKIEVSYKGYSDIFNLKLNIPHEFFKAVYPLQYDKDEGVEVDFKYLLKEDLEKISNLTLHIKEKSYLLKGFKKDEISSSKTK